MSKPVQKTLNTFVKMEADDLDREASFSVN